jgi:hypothetical protein
MKFEVLICMRYKKGDHVHVRIRKRKVGKNSKVDGSVSVEGIWVKGIFVETKKDGFVLVEHVD